MASRIFTSLAVGFIIDSSVFTKLTAEKQTEVLGMNKTGKPVIFVPSFATLANKKRLIEKLVKNENCSIELAFNEIVLSEVDKTALMVFGELIDRIKDTNISYEWLPDNNEGGLLGFNQTSISRRGYRISLKGAEKIWNAASLYWHEKDFIKPKSLRSMSVDGYSRSPQIHENSVVIGCQTITRAEIEYIAKHFAWKPVTETQ